MSLVLRKPVFGVSDQVRHTNRPVQLQKMARGLKFRIKVVEGLYYPCNEKPVFSQRGSYQGLYFWQSLGPNTVISEQTPFLIFFRKEAHVETTFQFYESYLLYIGFIQFILGLPGMVAWFVACPRIDPLVWHILSRKR